MIKLELVLTSEFLSMPRILGALLLLLLCVPARAESPGDIANPRVARRSWVADNAHVLSDATVRRIDDLLTRLERKTGAEVAVVTINSTDGMPIEDFANDLARRWKIGDKKEGKGLLLLTAINDRKVRMEVSLALQSQITDARTIEITREIIRPAFRAGKYDAGLYDATYAIVRRIDPSLPAPPDTAAPSTDKPPPSDAPPSDSPFAVPQNGAPPASAPPFETSPSYGAPPNYGTSSPGSVATWLVAIVGLGVGALVLTIWLGTQPPKCPRCKTRMELVPESDEDAFLTDAQQFEESIGGRDWKVWRCPKDGFVSLEARNRPMSGISDCRVCSNHTVTSHTQTLIYATEFQQGLEETTHVCQWPQCRHAWTTQRVMPRVMPVIIVSSGSSGGIGGGYDSGGSSSSGGGSYDSGPSDFGGGGDFDGGGGTDSW